MTRVTMAYEICKKKKSTGSSTDGYTFYQCWLNVVGGGGGKKKWNAFRGGYSTYEVRGLKILSTFPLKIFLSSPRTRLPHQERIYNKRLTGYGPMVLFQAFVNINASADTMQLAACKKAQIYRHEITDSSGFMILKVR